MKLDRSLPFATVHGDRPPGDLHQAVEYFQHGLPFNAQGNLVQSLVDADPDLQKRAEALGKRKAKADAVIAALGDDEADVQITPTSSHAGDDVNLEAWLRKEAKYQWFAISSAIHKRYSVRVTNQEEAVRLLVCDEKLLPAEAVHPSLRPAL